jgi:hypothetical protein
VALTVLAAGLVTCFAGPAFGLVALAAGFCATAGGSAFFRAVFVAALGSFTCLP